ncbi:guanylate kinase [Theileria orientalis strain Shintoku]|uniref:guanylate kinase n=1 Tax=Theileria orientalis strain Shintoku TaxID=869250 RepID=J4CD06_THEOR|nr:guanylate kinase [Theileria orientalis strain Shintoku]PVC51608.1 guanylate kinase [Theileria orientalis]BAM40307.1 guanylate kinase [Theileria orientalis strain Shintoku]|eukprot:XP_009690608.1 guanylate kinase [Theileria orientalis strain Shintoku]
MVNQQFHSSPPILVIVGPSGSGKTTLNDRLIVDHSDIFENSVSCTSRAGRKGEKDGVNYYFVSNEEFDRMAINNEFVEHAEYVGNKYGTMKSELNRILGLSKIPVLEIEMQGCKQVHKAGYPMRSVFIDPDDLEVLRQRLLLRGRDSEETINKRIERARQEILEAKSFPFDFILKNDDFDKAYSNMVDKLREWYPALNQKLTS